MATFSDDFNRADTNDTVGLGPDWDDTGTGEYGAGYGLKISGNQAIGDVDFGVCQELYGTPTSTAAMFAQADFDAGGGYGGNGSWQVGVNAEPTTFRSGYWLDKYEWYSEWYLRRNGTTVVTQGGYASAGGYTDVRIEHDGAGNLTAFEGGVEILTYTDGSPLTTNKYAGIASKGFLLDNFSAGDPQITLEQVNSVDFDPATSVNLDIAPAATATVGNLLTVQVTTRHSLVNLDTAVTGYTLVGSYEYAPTADWVGIYARVATGDASDDFSLATLNSANDISIVSITEWKDHSGVGWDIASATSVTEAGATDSTISLGPISAAAGTQLCISASAARGNNGLDGTPNFDVAIDHVIGTGTTYLAHVAGYKWRAVGDFTFDGAWGGTPVNFGAAVGIPLATAPGAPTIGTPVGLPVGNQVNWTAPVSDGGSAITGYLIERNEAGAGFTTLVADTASTATTYEDTTAVNGVSYTYRVSAINAIGTGAASAASSAVVPIGPVLFTDDFNRANAATLGAAWIDNKGEWGDGLEIASNQAESESGSEDASIYGTPVSTSAAFVEVDWIDDGNGDNWRTHLLMDVDAWDNNTAGPPSNGPTTGGANSGYNIHGYVWDNVLSLQKAATTVATVNVLPGSGAQNLTMRLEHDGAGGLTVYQDSVEELSYTDAGTIPTGRYVGLAAKGAEFDNFSAGDLFTTESRISETFRTIPDGTDLTDVSGWDAHTSFATGVLRSDTHTHSPDQVIDASSTNRARAIRTDKMLDSADQTVEVLAFHDQEQANVNPMARIGPMLRLQGTDASDVSGYAFEVTADNDGIGNQSWTWEFVSITAGTPTTILSGSISNAEVFDAQPDSERGSVHRITLQASGSAFTGWMNGVEVFSTTDTTYASGGYTGFVLDRINSATHGQPFVAGIQAWTPNETNQVFDVIGAAGPTSSTGLFTTSTARNGLDTFIETPAAGEVLVAIAGAEDAGATERTFTWGDSIGTTGWTEDASHWFASESTKVSVASKTAVGTETSAGWTEGDNYDGTKALAVMSLPEGWAVAEMATDTSITADPTTGTLSSKPKIGLLVHLRGSGNDCDFADNPDIRLLAPRLSVNDSGGDDARLGVAAIDLGTATTAVSAGQYFDKQGFDSTEAIIVLEYTAPGGGPSPQTWTGGAVSVDVTAASGTFISSGGPQTWAATAASINATASTESFSPGAVTWIANAASINATVSIGSFTSISNIIPQNLRLDIAEGSGDGKSSSSIWLLWDAVAGATGYDVRRNGSIVATDVAVTSYEDSGLSPDTEYTHEVRARFT